MIPAAPFLPMAAGMVAPPPAPVRPTALEFAPPAAINRERGSSAAAAEGQSNTITTASERPRDNGARATEVAPAATMPARPRPTIEPVHGAAAAPQPLVFRSDAGMTFAPAPAAAAPLMELAADDPTLHAAALGKTAHVRLDTGTDGDLALHMVVKDGVVDLRVDGTAAQALDIRQNEVRTALAGEGISLGRFEAAGASTGQSFGSSGGGFRDGTAEQAQYGNQASSSSSAPREGTFADAAATHTAGSQPQSQGNWGGGSRHFAGHEHNDARWADRDAPASPRAVSSNSSPSAGTAAPDARPRRGVHVTA